MSGSASAVVIGKLPAHGDFIARGIQGAARDEVDGWLAASDLAARDTFGEGWRDRFDNAPPWRFVRPTPDGLEAGVIAPSADKVGRRSPLLLWRGGLAPASGEQIAGAAEALAYDAIAGGWDADRLHAELVALPEPAGQDWSGDALWWTCDADGARVATRTGTTPSDLLTAMLACVEED